MGREGYLSEQYQSIQKVRTYIAGKYKTLPGMKQEPVPKIETSTYKRQQEAREAQDIQKSKQREKKSQRNKEKKQKKKSSKRHK